MNDLAERFPWIDPTQGYPSRGLIDGVEKIECRMVAVRHGGAHKSVPWIKAIHEDGMEAIDGADWEPFYVQHRGEIDAQAYYWGMFVLGLGFVNVMVPMEFVRELTDSERTFWSGRRMSMVGLHSGKESYQFNLPVE